MGKSADITVFAPPLQIERAGLDGHVRHKLYVEGAENNKEPDLTNTRRGSASLDSIRTIMSFYFAADSSAQRLHRGLVIIYAIPRIYW
jgi:hypothetical protein